MGTWLIADDQIKKEIIKCKAGLGRKKLRISNVVFGIFVLLMLAFFILQDSLLAEAIENGELLRLEFPMLVIMLLGFFLIWFMIFLSAYGIPMLIRFRRVRDGIVSYQYGSKVKEYIGEKGQLLVAGRLESGEEIVGKSEASDNHRNAWGMVSGNRIIAYRKGSDPTIYFSYVGK